MTGSYAAHMEEKECEHCKRTMSRRKSPRLEKYLRKKYAQFHGEARLQTRMKPELRIEK